MASNDTASFRLSVWRPARIERRLDYAQEQSEPAHFNSARLYEEIYHWHPGSEDVWAGISDQEISKDIRTRFIEGFAPDLSPEQRSMERFRETVAYLGEQLATDDVSKWSDLLQTLNERGMESINLRGDVALSLFHHMCWVVCTFGNVPGAAVTIR